MKEAQGCGHATVRDTACGPSNSARPQRNCPREGDATGQLPFHRHLMGRSPRIPTFLTIPERDSHGNQVFTNGQAMERGDCKADFPTFNYVNKQC